MTDDPVHGLGWIESPPDDADWTVDALYAAAGVVPPDAAALPGSYHVPAPLYPVLDQGVTPMCVAYSAAGEQGWYDLRDTGLATFDEPTFFAWIGGTASGAVIRDALAVRLKTGYPPVHQPTDARLHRIAAYYRVPTDRADLCAAVLSFGPVVVGTPWARSWFRPDQHGILPPFDTAVGGHALLAVGWDAAGLRLRNSWGADWGQGGEATLPWEQLVRLREAWKAIDVIDPGPAATTWRIRIAPHARVNVADVSASRCIVGWNGGRGINNGVQWGPLPSGAPCRQPVVKRGCTSGQATVAWVTAGVFKNKWVRIGHGVTAVASSAAAASEEDPQP